MKYYLLSNSANKNEIGVYPQTTGLVDGYEEFAENSMVNLNSDELPNFVPDLRFELEEKAILTDVISPSNLDYATGLMMNEKAKKIFEAKKIIPHAYYQATLKVKNKLLDYYWLHLVNPSFQYIDFSQSVFLEVVSVNESKQHCFITESEFEKFYSATTNSVRAHKIVLKQEIKSQNYDLLFFPFIHRGVIASELLCNELKAEKISGVVFEEQSII